MVRPRCQGEESFFGRVKLEYPRLKKKHGIRWMDIVLSLQLESFILTKLTKPLVRINLVGPQVSLQNGAPQMLGGVFIFLCVIRRHFLACEDIACVSELSAGETFFSRNMVARPVGPSSQGGNVFFTKYWWPVRWVPAVRWRNNYFPRNKEALP